MIKLIKFTMMYGNEIYINVNQITSIVADSVNTPVRISLTDGNIHCIKGTICEVIKQIEESEMQEGFLPYSEWTF